MTGEAVATQVKHVEHKREAGHDAHCNCAMCEAEQLLAWINTQISKVGCDCPACETAKSEARGFQKSLSHTMDSMVTIRSMLEINPMHDVAMHQQDIITATIQALVAATQRTMTSLELMMEAAHHGFDHVAEAATESALAQVAELLRERGINAGLGYVTPEGVLIPEGGHDPSNFN